MLISRSWLGTLAILLLPLTVKLIPAQPSSRAIETTVAGRTLDQYGKPLRKAVVALRSATGGAAEARNPLQTVVSDNEGRFRFAGVAPGDYTLWAEHAGFLTTAWGTRFALAPGRIVTVREGAQISDIAFQLTPEATISGNVVDGDGDPIPVGDVFILRRVLQFGRTRYMQVGSARLDRHGAFQFFNVGPGDLLLGVTPDKRVAWPDAGSETGDRSFQTTYYPGTVLVEDAAPVRVAAGQQIAGIKIVMRPQRVFHVRGKLSMAGYSGAVSKLRVGLFRAGIGLLGISSLLSLIGDAIAVSAGGEFDLPNISAGAYSLLLTEGQPIPRVLGQHDVIVGDRDLALSIPVDSLFAIKGTVEPDNPEALAGRLGLLDKIRVALAIGEEPAFNAPAAVTSADGSFQIPQLTRRSYAVVVRTPPAGTYVKAIRIGGTDALGHFVRLGANQHCSIVLGTDPARISGTVEREDGKPFPYAIVTLMPNPPLPSSFHLYRTANADVAGKFEIGDIAPGNYRAYAWEDLDTGTGRQYDVDLARANDSYAVRVKLSAKATETVRLRYIPAGRD